MLRTHSPRSSLTPDLDYWLPDPSIRDGSVAARQTAFLSPPAFLSSDTPADRCWAQAREPDSPLSRIAVPPDAAL